MSRARTRLFLLLQAVHLLVHPTSSPTSSHVCCSKLFTSLFILPALRPALISVVPSYPPSRSSHQLSDQLSFLLLQAVYLLLVHPTSSPTSSHVGCSKLFTSLFISPALRPAPISVVPSCPLLVPPPCLDPQDDHSSPTPPTLPPTSSPGSINSRPGGLWNFSKTSISLRFFNGCHGNRLSSALISRPDFEFCKFGSKSEN